MGTSAARWLAKASRRVLLLERFEIRHHLGSSGGPTLHAADEAYRAPVVVVTSGPWAGDLLRTAGIDLPLVPSLEQ